MDRLERARKITKTTDLSLGEAIEVVAAVGESPCCEALRVAFADNLTAYYRAHSAHWNVSGPAFGPYHEFFSMIADDLYGAVDPLAEWLLKMGDNAPSNIPQALAHATITPALDAGNDPRTLCVDLLEMNEALIASLNQLFAAANDENEQGLANFAAERIDASQKWAWQLRKSVS